MTIDYGLDLSCTDDLAEDMREIEGPLLLVQALYRRFTTPRGSLWEDPDYGLDVQDLLSKSMTQAQIDAIPSLIVAEAKKEEQVATFDAKVVKRDVLNLEIACTGTTADGPFSFVLSVDQASTKISNVQVGS